MTLETTNHRGRLAGKAAAVCCALFLLSAGDGLISGFRQPANELRLLPGEATKVNGSASDLVREPQDLEYAADGEGIRLSIEKIHTGFWLGGLMWRGTLTASSDVGAGDYTVTVRARGEPSGKPLTAFRVHIFADVASMQKSSASIIQRTTGISPWWSAAVSFMLAAVFSGLVFLCSQRREQLLKLQGKAEIYRIIKMDDEYEVSFALGKKQGVHTGMTLMLADETGLPLGKVLVRDVYDDDATGTITPDCPLKMGYLIILP